MMPQAANANDGTYFTKGNQLIPLHETDISIRREVLTITLTDNGFARVDVQYEFYNPGNQNKRVLMGFEADPSYNDDYTFHPDGVHPDIKNFTVEMNGLPLSYRNAACVSDKIPLMPIDTTKKYIVFDNNNLYEKGKSPMETGNYDDGISYSYVYYFYADFKPGINRVHHTYTYRLSVVVGIPWLLDYKLTPASRWAGGKIDDFTLVVRVENTAKHFVIFDDAFPGAKYTVTEGTGKVRQNKLYDNPCHEFSLRNGTIKLHTTNFSPKEELGIQAVGVYTLNNEPYRLGYSYDRTSSVFLWYGREEKPSDAAFLTRVAHNLPYAHRGHVFRDKRLKAYFESLWWYMTDPNYKDSDSDFTDVDRQYIEAKF